MANEEVIPSAGQLAREADSINAHSSWLSTAPGFFIAMGSSGGLATGGFFAENQDYKDALMAGAGAVIAIYLVWLAASWFLHFRRDDRHATDVDNAVRADLAEDDMRTIN